MTIGGLVVVWAIIIFMHVAVINLAIGLIDPDALGTAWRLIGATFLLTVLPAAVADGLRRWWGR